MAKKISAEKFRVSKVCETADLLVSAMEQAKKASANISQPVMDFDDSLVDAILKHLKGVSSEEVEKAYGHETLVEFVEWTIHKFDFIEKELGIPWDAPKKLPNCYI